MTVAAVILAATPESALADADGQPRVRRIADAAWSGGAIPIVVVAPDPNGDVARALAGAPVTLAEPAPPERGPAAQIQRGISVALEEVSRTTGALIWPARCAWVGPETATSLIEAHGSDPGSLLRPAYRAEAGWPVLLPTALADRLATVRPERMPDDIVEDLVAGAVALRLVDLGDPGVTHDVATPRADLPAYEGPSREAVGHTHEWGAAAADRLEDSPLEGPALAPFDRAAGTD